MENGAPGDEESASTEMEIPSVTGDLRSAGRTAADLRSAAKGLPSSGETD